MVIELAVSLWTDIDDRVFQIVLNAVSINNVVLCIIESLHVARYPSLAYLPARHLHDVTWTWTNHETTFSTK